MASDNELQNDEPRLHDEHEWDAQRDNFIHYYKNEKRTLKDATQCMITNHGFHATPRQWERKISAWGITKYTPRLERMHQIESQGRTLIEVAAGGRRPRRYSNTLDVDDDRNMRRFARRALSRSRSTSGARSRSSSAGQQTPCLSPRPEMQMDDLVVQERSYDLDVSVFMQNTDPSYVPVVPADQPTDNPHAHVMSLEDPVTGARHTELLIDFPASHKAQHTSLMGSLIHDSVAYEPFPNYMNGLDINQDQSNGTDVVTIQQGISPGLGFIPQSAEAMDTSPMHTQESVSPWQGSEAANIADMNTSFASNMTSMDPDFDQALLTPVQSNESNSSMQTPKPRIGSVPMVLISPDMSSDSVHNRPPAVGRSVAFTPVPIQDDLNLDNPYPDFSSLVEEYSLAVRQTFQSVLTSAQSPEVASDVACQLLEQWKAVFAQKMNNTLDSFVMSAQRSLRSSQDTNRYLKQRVVALEAKSKSFCYPYRSKPERLT